MADEWQTVGNKKKNKKKGGKQKTEEISEPPVEEFTTFEGENIYSYEGSPPASENCTGPDAECIRFISSENHIFKVWKKCALHSGLLSNMLNGPCSGVQEDEQNEVAFDELKTDVVRKVCEYLAYKEKYREYQKTMPEFIISDDKDKVLEIFLAADYLDC